MKRFLTAGNLLGLALTGIILATSCQKVPIPSVPADDSKLVKLTYDGEEANFVYNTDGTLKEATVTDDLATGGEAVKYTISYNAQKKISQVVTSENQTLVPTYQNNRLTQIDSKNAAGQVEGKTTFTYNNSNQVSEVVYALKTQNQFTPWIKFEFKFSAQGNASEIKTYLYDILQNKLELAGYAVNKYDDKPNPMASISDFLLFIWQAPNTNNIVKEEHFFENNTVDEVVEYTYNYNSFNKPVSAAVKRTTPNTPAQNFTVQYQYTR